jgi:hypothetical protein
MPTKQNPVVYLIINQVMTEKCNECSKIEIDAIEAKDAKTLTCPTF